MPSLASKLFAEFLGTAFLCFTVSCLPQVAADNVGLVVGSVLTVLVYTCGPVSGAHLNPAVTLAVILRGGLIEARDAMLYVAHCGLYAFADGAYPAPAKGVGTLEAIITEMVFTMALSYVVLMVATREESTGNSYFGLAIGLVLVSSAYCIGPTTGCAINPAVGILAVLHASPTWWVYFVGPLLGGALGGVIYHLATAGKSYSPLVVEFFGTYHLCAAIATSVSNGTKMAPVAIGSMLAAFVYAGGPASGGMYNPAVALAVWARSLGTDLEPLLSAKTLGVYSAVQVAGALCAALDFNYFMDIGHPAVGEGAGVFSAVLAEMIGTGLLTFTVLSVATVSATKDNGYFGLAIGLVVVVAASTVGGVSGGAFNPAVSILAVIAGSYSVLVYWVGPALGAILGVAAFRAAYADAFPSAALAALTSYSSV